MKKQDNETKFHKHLQEKDCSKPFGHEEDCDIPESHVDFRDESLVYYGPHSCQRCDAQGKLGTLIVKAGNGAPEYLGYNFVHGSHYPNHVWVRHECIEKPAPPYKP